MMKRRISFALVMALVLGLCVGSFGKVSEAKAKKISISMKSMTLKVGQKKSLKLKNVSKKLSKKVKWKSSKKKIATVNKNGVVKAKAKGKATITATYKKKKYTCKLTVKASAATPKPSSKPTEPVAESKLSLFQNNDFLKCSCDDDALFLDTKTYQPELAKCSLAAAILSDSVIIPSEEEYEKSELQQLVEGFGFTGFAVNDEYKTEPTSESVGVACAYRELPGTDEAVVAVFVRSCGYKAEWASNMNVGDGTDMLNHVGFELASEKTLAFIREYTSTLDPGKKIRFWLSGQSRGAAIANLTAAHMIEQGFAAFPDGKPVTADDVVAYCFATPQAVYAGMGEEKKDLTTGYEYIHNVLFVRDVVCRIPPSQFGFDVYGVKEKDVYNSDRYETILDGISLLNQSIVDSYKECKDTDYGGMTQSEWIESFVDKFSETVVDRKTFTEEYQRPITYMLESFFGGGSNLELTPEETGRLVGIGVLFVTYIPGIIIDHYPEVEYVYLCAKE